MKRWLVVLLVVAAGCDPLAPRTNVVKTRYYSIAPNVDVQPATPTAITIGIRELEYARVYKEPIVYREAAHEVKIYEHDEWTELPRDTVTRAIQDALAKTTRFADVGDAIAMRAPDYTLTGELRAFEEVRNDGNPRARVEVRLSMRQSLKTDGNSAVWSDILSAEVPLPEDNAAGIAEAMSEAVAQIAESAATTIAGLDLHEAGP